MIRCQCLKPHPEHDFRAGPLPQICGTCGHGIGLHIAQGVADQVTRLITLYDIASWRADAGANGGLDLTLHLRPRDTS